MRESIIKWVISPQPLRTTSEIGLSLSFFFFFFSLYVHIRSRCNARNERCLFPYSTSASAWNVNEQKMEVPETLRNRSVSGMEIFISLATVLSRRLDKKIWFVKMFYGYNGTSCIIYIFIYIFYYSRLFFFIFVTLIWSQ